MLLLTLALCTCARAQRMADRLIVAYTSEAPVKKARGDAQRRALAPDIDLLHFTDSAAAAKAYQRLRVAPGVRALQYDYRVTWRAVPDDPLYARQENFGRAGFETVWEKQTGGRTAGGVPIVTAVLDGGFATDHEDLVANLWRNPGEVAGDGIDNDGNGYVDDLHGWNFIGDTASYDADPHGTAVAGLLGAVGNNGIGVTGANWDASLMLLEISTVADIIAAYQYIIDQRTAFRESAGRRGAFVVVTNASFGIEGATCSDYPVWGGMYDRLGAAGILTAASVSNVAEDVDAIGDVPTDCPSEFLLAVTNLGVSDGLFPSAGYGRTVVDLAAPGEGSYSTRPNNGYAPFGSTSAAAPYVAGAVALLYATPCPAVAALTDRDPPAAARLVRDALLASTVSRPSLAGRTVTGGSLDVAAARDVLLFSCVSDTGPLEVLSVVPNPSDGRMTVLTSATALSSTAAVVVYDMAGHAVVRPRTDRVAGNEVGVTIDISRLPAGYYVVELRDGDRVARAPCIIF